MTDTTTSTTAHATTTEPAGRPDHLVSRPDGRTLAVDDHGPTDGPVVVLLHSAPGSRRLDPDPAATAAAGVRLITIDRAGYGDSTPLDASVLPTITGHADDTAAVLDHLGITDAAIAGWSAGGRVALALAARRPELVRAVAVVGTPAPDDEVPWVPQEHRDMVPMLRANPLDAAPLLTGIFAGAEGFDPTDPSGVGAGPADDAVLADPARRAAVVAMLAEGSRPGPAGVAADIVADQVAPWSFDLGAIGAPVSLFYGDADVVVSPAHGEWYAARLADADLHVIEGAGHLLVLTQWSQILAALA